MAQTPRAKSDQPKGNSFPRRLRMSGGADFMSVYQAKARVSLGPLLFQAAPNELPYPRLGLAISRRAGNAVKRNAIKRRLREAFRLGRHEWPAAYDLVVSARAHDPKPTAEYALMMSEAIERLHRVWMKKQAKPKE
jgi:ribonuclease P protein component